MPKTTTNSPTSEGGAALLRALKKKKHTQAHCEILIGAAPSYVSAIIAGKCKPGRANAAALYKTYGVRPAAWDEPVKAPRKVVVS